MQMRGAEPPTAAEPQAELLADVLLGTSSATGPTPVAWCPVNGLLAVGARQHAKLACVHLISPYCVEHKVSLAVPLQGKPALPAGTVLHACCRPAADAARLCLLPLLCLQALRTIWCAWHGLLRAAGGCC